MQSTRLSITHWLSPVLQAILGVLMTTAYLFQVGRGYLIIMDWQIITHSLYTAKKHDALHKDPLSISASTF